MFVVLRMLGLLLSVGMGIRRFAIKATSLAPQRLTVLAGSQRITGCRIIMLEY